MIEMLESGYTRPVCCIEDSDIVTPDQAAVEHALGPSLDIMLYQLHSKGRRTP